MGGLLDKKERIFDIILTNKGRELLSKNQLNFTWYTFSDDSIDYSGSIKDTLATTGSLDDYMQKMFINEVDQRNTRKSNDLKNFLFTAPINTNILPEFRISLTGSINLKMKYKTISFIDAVKNKPSGDVFVKTALDTLLSDRHSDYLMVQRNNIALLKDSEPLEKDTEDEIKLKSNITILSDRIKKWKKELGIAEKELERVLHVLFAGGLVIELRDRIDSLKKAIKQNTDKLNAFKKQLG